MPRPRTPATDPLLRAQCALALVFAAGGCTGLLGDFGAGPAGDGGTLDTGVHGSSGGATGGDAGDGSAAPSEAAPPADAPPGDGAQVDAPPLPPPGKPGFDLTAAGNTSTSPNYVLLGAVGESPGGNIIVGRSSSYILKGGVIAGTQ